MRLLERWRSKPGQNKSKFEHGVARLPATNTNYVFNFNKEDLSTAMSISSEKNNFQTPGSWRSRFSTNVLSAPALQLWPRDRLTYK